MILTTKFEFKERDNFCILGSYSGPLPFLPMFAADERKFAKIELKKTQ
jgi:hypothetical protein